MENNEDPIDILSLNFTNMLADSVLGKNAVIHYSTCKSIIKELNERIDQETQKGSEAAATSFIKLIYNYYKLKDDFFNVIEDKYLKPLP